jgi:hypothetical protein
MNVVQERVARVRARHPHVATRPGINNAVVIDNDVKIAMGRDLRALRGLRG